MSEERIHLSEHFTYRKLFKFVLPSIFMMVFISVYGIVDGFFVSNFAGDNGMPFQALNLIYPFIMILGSVGFMLGTGGNAEVSKALGEGDEGKANKIFSMLVYATVIIGIALGLVGIFLARPIAELFASTEKDLTAEEKARLIDYCVIYARIILAALPAFMLQNAFQGFFVTAEKPKLGLYVTLFAGFGNVFFDALFVVGCKWGLVGAAVATALNQLIGGVLPLIYFANKNNSLLRLGKTKFDGKVFIKVCVNGMSELMTNISLSVIAILYNAQLMGYIGLDGVSAYGIMQYISFIFIGIFIGYAVGSAPIIGYHYGANNREELRNIYTKSLKIMTGLGILMTIAAIAFAYPLSAIFVQEETLLKLTARGLRIYSVCFLLAGVNIFASSFFTALSNGVLSLLISFFRTFLCQAIAVIVLPLLWGVDGIWSAVIFAELFTLILTVILFIANRKRYGYMK
ncbi:MAG: MATE family efflux transporter [Clostridiales bacterium]|nr:MATE family efflux transporter [Clostridiales bacterium]